MLKVNMSSFRIVDEIISSRHREGYARILSLITPQNISLTDHFIVMK